MEIKQVSDAQPLLGETHEKYDRSYLYLEEILLE
jgi:hypothetical protein